MSMYMYVITISVPLSRCMNGKKRNEKKKKKNYEFERGIRMETRRSSIKSAFTGLITYSVVYVDYIRRMRLKIWQSSLSVLTR